MSGKSGAENNNWKGGRTVASHGYVLIRRPDHPRADVRGYVYEHILVAEENLRRPIEKGEEVHHINEDRADNRWENLEVTASRAEHRVHHRTSTLHSRAVRLPGEDNPTINCACGCGMEFPKYDSVNRQRRFISGHNLRMPA
jgi:hypothetical protein